MYIVTTFIIWSSVDIELLSKKQCEKKRKKERKKRAEEEIKIKGKEKERKRIKKLNRIVTRSDEGLALKTSALECLHGGQFTNAVDKTKYSCRVRVRFLVEWMSLKTKFVLKQRTYTSCVHVQGTS